MQIIISYGNEGDYCSVEARLGLERQKIVSKIVVICVKRQIWHCNIYNISNIFISVTTVCLDIKLETQ